MKEAFGDLDIQGKIIHTATEEARKAAEEGDCFVVDYVRVFDKVK